MEKSLIKRTFSGVLIGAANGLFGGGGGMIAVPLLQKNLGYAEKQAHATAIFVIAPLCLASAITYIIFGYADLNVIIPATIGNVAGGLIGAEFLAKLSRIAVNVAFIAVMLAAGVRMVLG